MQQSNKLYKWRASTINPHFAGNFKIAKRESCLLSLKYHNKRSENEATKIFLINTAPRRYNHYLVTDLDTYMSHRATFDSSQSIKFKIRQKALKYGQLMDNIISAVNNKKKANSIFITLTLPEKNKDLKDHLRIKNQYLKRKGYTFMYFWVLEFGKNNNNPHYHIVYTVMNDKINIKDFHFDTKNLKWKGRTKTEFVKKSVYNYMCKYATKQATRCYNYRNVGFSQLFVNL